MIYKIEKKLPVGYLGTIYLLQWETEDEIIENEFFKKLKYFCVYINFITEIISMQRKSEPPYQELISKFIKQPRNFSLPPTAFSLYSILYIV